MHEDDLRDMFLDAQSGLRKGTPATEANVDLVLDESDGSVTWYELKLTSAVDLGQLSRQREAQAASLKHHSSAFRHVLAVADAQLDGYGAAREGFSVVELSDLCNDWLSPTEAEEAKAEIQAATTGHRRIQQQRRLLDALREYDARTEVDLTIRVQATGHGAPSITIERREVYLPELEWFGPIDVVGQLQFPRSDSSATLPLIVNIGLRTLGNSDPTADPIEARQVAHLLASRAELDNLMVQLEQGRDRYVRSWTKSAMALLPAVEESLKASGLEVSTRSGRQLIDVPEQRYRKGFSGSYQGLSLRPTTVDDVLLLKAVDEAIADGIAATKEVALPDADDIHRG